MTLHRGEDGEMRILSLTGEDPRGEQECAWGKVAGLNPVLWDIVCLLSPEQTDVRAKLTRKS